jgi:hypothetical protein
MTDATRLYIGLPTMRGAIGQWWVITRMPIWCAKEVTDLREGVGGGAAGNVSQSAVVRGEPEIWGFTGSAKQGEALGSAPALLPITQPRMKVPIPRRAFSLEPPTQNRPLTMPCNEGDSWEPHRSTYRTTHAGPTRCPIAELTTAHAAVPTLRATLRAGA